MKLNITAQIIFTGLLVAVLSACGSGTAENSDNGQTVVQSDTANFIDKNKNGVKDADEVYDANHNNVDDATECLGGDIDHNGRIEGAEKNSNDSNHNGVNDDNDTDYTGVKGQCSSDDKGGSDDNGSGDDDKNKK